MKVLTSVGFDECGKEDGFKILVLVSMYQNCVGWFVD
jgi:hypothetical protein